MPVGNALEIQVKLTIEAPGVTVIWNPKFLREGYAVKDTIAPDRFIYGLPDLSDAHTVKSLLDEVNTGPLANGIPLVSGVAGAAQGPGLDLVDTDPQATVNARAAHPQLEIA